MDRAGLKESQEQNHGANAPFLLPFFLLFLYIYRQFLRLGTKKDSYFFAFMNTYPKSHLKAAALLAIVLTIVITALPAHEKPERFTTPVPLTVVKETAQPTLSESASDAKPAALPAVLPAVLEEPIADRWEKVRVKPGDNLAKIFQRLKLSPAVLQQIVDLGPEVSTLRKIMPGQELAFQLNLSGELLAIHYKKNVFDTLVISRREGRFSANWVQAVPEKIIAYETANITRDQPSLYHAGKAAGLSDNIIMKLSYIFQWDISFALDLRAGDSFSLMYEQIYIDGEKVKEGEIIAASFTNMGKTHDAIRYTDTGDRADYYTPDGRSLRKAFLRDPVHFSHVSSSFNLNRMHPIHKKRMPHRGIDYAARKGTPVLAAGDGKVTISRQNNASGKYVVIQHGEQYTTKYLHLSAFANGVKPGKTVRQGQTIGYVGATGWATAPHLHYEFLVNGVHRNPRTVKLPKANPIHEDEMARFRASISPVLAQLQSISGQSLASAGATGAGE